LPRFPKDTEGSLDVASKELLALFIVRDKRLLVELSEYSYIMKA
jgi:hypothetical protein